MTIISTAEEIGTGQFWRVIPLWGYVELFLTFLVLILGLALHFENKEKLELRANVANFASAQKTNLATIAQLQLANNGWADEMAKEIANSKTYLDAANDYAQQQQAKAKKAQSTLDSIYANHPESKAWSVVPVDLSVGVQLRANAGSR